MIFISACLMGIPCRYNGGKKPNQQMIERMKGKEVCKICPECMVLPTPRPSAEISGGTGKDVIQGKARVINREGKDVTVEFLVGARDVLEKAKQMRPERIYLKKYSPSCGVGEIYDGTFTGTKREGNGVLAQMLLDAGFCVIAAEEKEKE